MTKTDLPPGGEGEISVKVSTSGRKGILSKSVKVYSSDPDNPVAKISVKANIIIEMGFVKPYLYLRDAKLGEPKEQKVKMIIKEHGKYKPTKVSTTSKALKAEIVSEKGKDKTEYYIKSRFVPDKLGSVMEKVKVETNHPDYKTITLSMRGFIHGPIVYTPRQVTFRSQKGKIHKPRTIKFLSDKTTFKITGIQAPEDLVKYEIKADEGGKKYSVTFTPLKKLEKYKRSKIKVKTDNKVQPEIEMSLIFLAPGTATRGVLKSPIKKIKGIKKKMPKLKLKQ